MGVGEKVNGWMDTAAQKVVVVLAVLLVGGAVGTFQERLFGQQDLDTVRESVNTLNEDVAILQRRLTVRENDARRMEADFRRQLDRIEEKLDRALELHR